MDSFLAFFTLRGVVIFVSTAFSLLVVLLALNIVTTDDLSTILNLSTDATNALQQVISRLQEVTHNIIDIISQLLKKLLNWAGVKHSNISNSTSIPAISKP